MNYLIIGEPCVDIIHKANNEVSHSYGGILYSILSMAVLSNENDSIIPVMNLGEDQYENIINVFRKYPNIKINGINKVKHPTRKVNLFYNMYNTDKRARVEKSTEPTYTVDYFQCEYFLKMADMILINMISGVDITLGTLRNIRRNFSGFIHIDIHNIVMQTKEDGSRIHAPVDNWYEWCTNSDTVQMNEHEMASLSREKLSEYKIAEEILFNKQNEVKGLIVTRGIDGVSGFIKKEKNFGSEKFLDIDHINIHAIENPHFADSTGCGDVFAASFAMNYAQSSDFEASIHYANRIASINASLNGIEELHKLR